MTRELFLSQSNSWERLSETHKDRNNGSRLPLSTKRRIAAPRKCANSWIGFRQIGCFFLAPHHFITLMSSVTSLQNLPVNQFIRLKMSYIRRKTFISP